MNDTILSDPYVILADRQFWTGRSSFEGGWSEEYPDAWKFTDDGQACTVADALLTRYPDHTITVWENYGDAAEQEVYLAALHPHSHSWRLILDNGQLAATEAVPIIDREGLFSPATAMTPGCSYRCPECSEQLTVDDPDAPAIIYTEADIAALAATARSIVQMLTHDTARAQVIDAIDQEPTIAHSGRWLRLALVIATGLAVIAWWPL